MLLWHKQARKLLTSELHVFINIIEKLTIQLKYTLAITGPPLVILNMPMLKYSHSRKVNVKEKYFFKSPKGKNTIETY